MYNKRRVERVEMRSQITSELKKNQDHFHLFFEVAVTSLMPLFVRYTEEKTKHAKQDHPRLFSHFDSN
jgi:predicted 2-oxoglutarate/Fe(II)-dependent dioxygenase YbiX